MRTIIALVASTLALQTSPSAASGYKMGFGGGGLNLFPYGLLPEYSGPFSIGGGYGLGPGRAESAPHLRLGLTMIEFDGIEPLGRPRGMVQIDAIVHFDDDIFTTVSAGYQHGIGRLLVGGGVGLATNEVDEETQRALLVVPELSLPLRGRTSKTFTPAMVFYARGEVAASNRDRFGDRFMLGLSLVVP